jgi:hypothetical protein
MSKLTAKDHAAMKKIVTEPMRACVPQDTPAVTTPAMARPVTTSHNDQRSVGTRTGGIDHRNPGGKPGESGKRLAARVLRDGRK